MTIAQGVPPAGAVARRVPGHGAAGGGLVYPTHRAARDRFVLAARERRTRPGPDESASLLVEDERDEDGHVARTATVFLVGRECPWRCVMCDLWQYTTVEDTPPGALPRQLTQALADLARRGETVAVVKLYNAGSFFDRRAVPEADDAAIVDALGAVTRVIVESHPSLVGDRTWRLRDALARRGTTLEVAMGLETAHPVALAALNKGISPDRFAAAAERLRGHGVAMRAFVLIHPPFIAREEQRAWLARSVAFADACSATAVSLIPTREGEGALRALAAAGAFVPPRLLDVEHAAVDARQVTARRVFVDLWELPRLVTCEACAASRVERLRAFNLTQVLAPAIRCATCGEAAAA